MIVRRLVVLVGAVVIAQLSGGLVRSAEFATPGYHADPTVVCLDGGPEAPEQIIVNEPAIHAMTVGAPYQVVGWLPILFKSARGPGGAQDFQPWVLDSPVDASHIHWFVAGPNGRAIEQPEQLTFERVAGAGARFKVGILYVWLDANLEVAASDVQHVERHIYTAEFMPFPLPYCDFATFSTIPMTP